MISVLLNWIYIVITAFLVGFAVCRMIDSVFGYRVRQPVSITGIGIVTVTVYAQVFSLFYKVGAMANLLLVLACLVTVLVSWRQIADVVSLSWRDKGTMWKLVMAVSVAVWCFCTSRGYMHYDSDLYHAQSIRWIEEYGIVKGLGNIHVRFAYNSSFFALSALYSLHFLGIRPLHAVNGLMALLLWTQVLPLFYTKKHRRNRTLVTDFARLGALYYLTVIYSDVVAPASDYAIMCAVFFIVIKWLSLLESKEESAVPYALLCVAGVYAVTLKLTAGVILILLLKPVRMLLQPLDGRRRWREIGLYLMMGLITAAPWLARTVILSGYLLYPFPALDIFLVDWKMDTAVAARDAAEIKAYGRGLNSAQLAGLPPTAWMPAWFQALPALGKLFILADFVCLLLFCLLAVRAVCSKRKSDPMYGDYLLVLGAVMASYVFWQFSAPLLRYGYAYVLLVFMITAGILCDILIKYFDKRQKRDIIEKTAALSIVLVWGFCAVKLVSLVEYIDTEREKPAYVWQQDYGKYPLESYEVNGVRFYYPTEGDRTGYERFPSLPRQTEIYFRGESVDEGFWSKTKGMETNEDK